MGISNSGKTTWAEEKARDKSWINANLDDFRRVLSPNLLNYKYNEKNELIVSNMQIELAEQSTKLNKNIIISDTNLNENRRNFWKNFAVLNDMEYSEKVFDTDLKTCVERNLKRAYSIPQQAIIDQSKKMRAYLGKPVYTRNTEGPNAIICDIDGTIAKMNRDTRSPYEWDKVAEDEPIDSIIRLIRKYSDHVIFLMSGRDESCRVQTESWLLHHDVPYDMLLMRPAGNNDSDVEVKEKLFWDNNVHQSDIEFVLDDRDSVVWMWRELGLKVLQVEPGGF